MNYSLYFIIFGAFTAICIVYARFAGRRAGKVQAEAAADGYTVENFMRQPQQVLEELLSDPDWFLHLRQKLQPERVLVFTQCARYEASC